MPFYPPHLPQAGATQLWNLFFWTDLYFNFHDGHGPVRAHQGRNPDGSQRGWIAETASVEDSAHVSRDSVVCQRARVARLARIESRSYIFGHALVDGQAIVSNNTRVGDRAHVGGTSRVSDASVLRDFVTVEGTATVAESVLGGYARVDGQGEIFKTTITGNCALHGATVARCSRLEGAVKTTGQCRVDGSDLEGRIELVDSQIAHVLARRDVQIVRSQLLGLSHIDNIELGGGMEIVDTKFEGTMRAYDKQSLQLYLEGYSPLRRAFVPAAARI
jgi:hypothetical protein